MKRPEKITFSEVRSSRALPFLVRVRPLVRRDLPCVGQLDRAHGQHVAAFSACSKLQRIRPDDRRRVKGPGAAVFVQRAILGKSEKEGTSSVRRAWPRRLGKLPLDKGTAQAWLNLLIRQHITERDVQPFENIRPSGRHSGITVGLSHRPERRPFTVECLIQIVLGHYRVGGTVSPCLMLPLYRPCLRLRATIFGQRPV